jgi:hypothetical protein
VATHELCARPGDADGQRHGRLGSRLHAALRSTQLAFDATDSNGIPDAVTLNVPEGVTVWVQSSKGAIQVASAGLTLGSVQGRTALIEVANTVAPVDEPAIFLPRIGR